MKFKTGNIVFFNWGGFYSSLIERHNKKEYGQKGYTHIGIITKIKKNEVQIHEALSRGFVKSWYPKSFLEDKKKEGKVEIKEINKTLKLVEENADQYLGNSYAWKDIISIIISSIFGFRLLRLTGADKLICSEAVARILYDASNKKINFAEEYDKPYDLITPMDIYYSEQFDA